MLPLYEEALQGNPSSQHAAGRRARALIDAARQQVAALVGAHPTEVIFTSGGTEANNAALKGIAWHHPGATLLYSEVEHAAVSAPIAALARAGWQQGTLAVDSDGRVAAETLRQQANDALLCSVMWANNETGVLQDIPALAEAARSAGALLHSDAVQAAGKVTVDFRASGLQMLSLSAHKLYGPKGVGALIVDKGLTLEPLHHGGGQEQGRRGGTENLAAIVGFGVAAELAQRELEQYKQINNQVKQLENGLATHIPQAVVFGQTAPRLPNTCFVAIPGIEGQTLAATLDRAGIAVSSGAACGSSHNRPSAVLAAMGVAPDLARAAIRISFGRGNLDADVEQLLQVLRSQAQQLQAMAALAW